MKNQPIAKLTFDLVTKGNVFHVRYYMFEIPMKGKKFL